MTKPKLEVRVEEGKLRTRDASLDLNRNFHYANVVKLENNEIALELGYKGAVDFDAVDEGGELMIF